MRRRRPSRHAGFSLLEAIVALAIFSMGAMALYGWLASSLRTIERVQAGSERAATMQLALDAVRGLNPMLTPSGRREIADLDVVWASTAIEPPRAVVTQTGLPTIFEAGLYRVDVRVLRAGEQLVRFDVRQTGYRQVRELEE